MISTALHTIDQRLVWFTSLLFLFLSGVTPYLVLHGKSYLIVVNYLLF